MSVYSDSLELIGGLSNPSKMPGFSYSLPAAECPIGSQLAKVEGTTCHDCYALKGMYRFPNVQDAMYRRLDSVRLASTTVDCGSDWVDAFAIVLNHKLKSSKGTDTSVFRWHDSGDLQNMVHLCLILEVAESTPDIRHWLPTRETKLIMDYLSDGDFLPSNLNIRISESKVDRYTSNAVIGMMEMSPQITSSLVHTSPEEPKGFSDECSAYKTNNECGDCRLCWSTDAPIISYLKH